MLTLVRRSLGRLSWLWAGMIILLAAFQTSIIAAAVSLEEAGDFQRLVAAVPAFVREAIGPALMTFAGMSVLSFFEPLLVLLCVLFAMYVASEPAGDVESGLVDLLLARPLSRHVIVTRSLIVTTITAATLVLSMGAINAAAVRLMAPPDTVGPTGTVVALMMAHLFALTWCFGALTLGLASGLRRRSSALGLMMLFAGAMYLVNLLAVLAPRFEAVGRSRSSTTSRVARSSSAAHRPWRTCRCCSASAPRQSPRRTSASPGGICSAGYCCPPRPPRPPRPPGAAGG